MFIRKINRPNRLIFNFPPFVSSFAVCSPPYFVWSTFVCFVPPRTRNCGICSSTLKFRVTFPSVSTTDSYKSFNAYVFMSGCTIKVLLVEYCTDLAVTLRIWGRAVNVTCAEISVSQTRIKLLCHAVIPHCRPPYHTEDVCKIDKETAARTSSIYQATW